MYQAELGKPYMLLKRQTKLTMRYLTVRRRNSIEGRRKGQKAKATFVTKEDRGSNFAPTRKGADLSYGISWQERTVNL